MNEAPPFWFSGRSWQAALLAPVSWLYGWVVGRRMLRKPVYSAEVPVICIGNFVAGGAGKTPTAIALAMLAKKKKLRPVFLTRGYGGGVNAPVFVDRKTHNSHDVGDEALLLAKVAPTLVCSDRVVGAKIIDQEDKYDLIIMDDGFQNPLLARDVSLVVVDGRRGVGNGHAHPGGPLRALLSKQFQRTDALLVIGDGDEGAKVLRQAAKRAISTHIAKLKPGLKTKLKNKEVLAYAGIGDPEKFYQSLRENGALVEVRKDFPDHHHIQEDEAQDLLERAARDDLQLVTTEKDFVRFAGHHAGHGGDPSALDQLQELSWAVPVKLEFDHPTAMEPLLELARRKFLERRLLRSS